MFWGEIKQEMSIKSRALLKLGSILPMKARVHLLKMAGMRIGGGTKIPAEFYIDRPESVVIGSNCFFNHHVHLHCGVSNVDKKMTIGNNVWIGPETVMFLSSHEIGDEKQRAGKITYGSIDIEDGVWIGAHVTVFPDVTIKHGCVIGAGALLTKSTEPNGLYYGCPARLIRKLESE